MPMIDAILHKIGEWLNKYMKEIAYVLMSQKLVPFVENELHLRCWVAATLEVTELNSFDLVYGVIGDDGKNYLVDLKRETCSCKYFDIDKYPCVHAVAASNKFFKQDDCQYDMRDLFVLCSPYYLMNVWGMAYRRTIYPVPHMSEWIVLEETKKLYASPPQYTKRHGRVNERRYPSVGER